MLKEQWTDSAKGTAENTEQLYTMMCFSFNLEQNDEGSCSALVGPWQLG